MKITRELIKGHAGQILRVGIFVVWLAILIASMSIMLVYASQKTIEIADTTSDGKQQEAGVVSQNARTRLTFFEVMSEQEKQFQIPLPADIQADAVSVENRYMDKELWITIAGATREVYVNQTIIGSTSVIEAGYLEAHETGITLKFYMSDLYEYRTTLNNEFLTIRYHEPHELYETVVVVDASGACVESAENTETDEATGNKLQEKELILAVAKKLQQQFTHEKIKLYFTGMEEGAVSDEKIVQLIESSDADVFISLGAESSAGRDYGIAGYYNDTYYIDGYDNVDVADALTRNVTIAAKNKSLGLFVAGQDDLLRRIEVPAARVSLGCLTHEKEGQLLKEEQYREKLAQGVYEAVLEMHEALHPVQEEQ